MIVIGDGAILVAFGKIDKAANEIGDGVVRIDTDGVIAIGDGAILVAFGGIGNAAIVIGDGAILRSLRVAARQNPRAAVYLQIAVLLLLAIAPIRVFGSGGPRAESECGEHDKNPWREHHRFNSCKERLRQSIRLPAAAGGCKCRTAHAKGEKGRSPHFRPEPGQFHVFQNSCRLCENSDAKQSNRIFTEIWPVLSDQAPINRKNSL